MKLTHVQAGMVATAFFDGMQNPKQSLCCAEDADEACAVIVGRRRAKKLSEWFYCSLGCKALSEETVQDWLYKIAALADV